MIDNDRFERVRKALGDDLIGMPREEAIKLAAKRAMEFLRKEASEMIDVLPEPVVKECCGKDGLFHFGYLGHVPPVLVPIQIPCPHCGFGDDGE